MDQYEIPKKVLDAVPEVEWCCGSLLEKERLLDQLSAIVNRAAALEQALGELDPRHPLLIKRVPNDERSIKSSPFTTPSF